MDTPDAGLLLGSALHAARAAVTARPALYDVAALINSVLLSAVDSVPGAESGGVSIESNGAGGAHGSTSQAAADLDALQHHAGGGPCLTALREPSPGRAVVCAHDLGGRDADRWPEFAVGAVELGVPAVMSLQLPAVTGVGAALNLYSSQVDGFEPADLVMADLFVGHLAHLLFGRTQGDQVGEPRSTAVDLVVEDVLRRRLHRPALES